LEINKALVGALRQCDTEELLEDAFSRFGLSGCLHKTECLIEAMGSPFILLDNNNHENCYSAALSIFLSGKWKINKFDERAFLIKIERLFCDLLWKNEFRSGLIEIQRTINRISEKLIN